jgi:UDP-N-acetylmuramyl pentapeptide phosphotransferase/UDP-N-acetylglucosamine-1-phosphate transferase
MDIIHPMFNLFYIISIISGSLGAWAMNKYAFKWGFIDRPNNRSSHRHPTPKGGAIGILAAFILSALSLKIALTLWFPASCLAIVSFFGDRFHISHWFRLSLQFIAASILVAPLYTSDQFSIFWMMFYILVIVATANWYNFMDGINGIAGITGIAGFGLLAAFNFLSAGASHFTILSLCIAASCLGFLPFNMPKAKVFMGDVGSILLGFVFASLVVILSKSFLDFVCLVSFMFPFYADELITLAIRLKDHESLFKPHRRHLYQLLANEMGIAHWRVSMGYGFLQFVVGLVVLFVRPFGIYVVLLTLLLFISGFIGVNYFVRREIVR